LIHIIKDIIKYGEINEICNDSWIMLI
jgi:hypothetical protein